jgi:hypothetical protein
VLKVELHTAEIPETFTRFQDVIGERHWLKRVSLIKADIRGHRFLKDYLIEENAIAFALAECSNLMHRHGVFPMEAAENRALYPAISFAAQTLSIIDQSSKQQAKRLIRRIHGAFQNPDEMRAFRFEMMVATHFVQRGYTIFWPEMEETGTFDILVEDIGTNGLQVECKSVSHDKGRKIHRREALEFFQLIKPQLVSASRNLQSGLAVVLTVPDRLPTSIQQRKELVRGVIGVVLTTQNMRFDNGNDIRISDFDVSVLGNPSSIERPFIAREAIDKATDTRNREVMVIGSQKGGAIAFALQSQQDDTLLQYVFDTVSQSAKKQVSKTRPALFLVGLDSLGSKELFNVAMQDFDPQQHPTALRVAVSKFLVNQERDHVVGVGFLSNNNLESKQQGKVESGGTAYVFPKRESSFWHQDFSGLFS